MAADFETNTILIKNLDLGTVQRGLNKFSPVVVNKTESLVTLVLDLRADPGLWLCKSQRQFVYLLYPKQEQVLSAEYGEYSISSRCSRRSREQPVPLVIADCLYVDAAFPGDFDGSEPFHASILGPYCGTEFKRRRSLASDCAGRRRDKNKGLARLNL